MLDQAIDLFRGQGFAPGRHHRRLTERRAAVHDDVLEVRIGELLHLLGAGEVARRDGQVLGNVGAVALAPQAMALGAIFAGRPLDRDIGLQ